MRVSSEDGDKEEEEESQEEEEGERDKPSSPTHPIVHPPPPPPPSLPSLHPKRPPVQSDSSISSSSDKDRRRPAIGEIVSESGANTACTVHTPSCVPINGVLVLCKHLFCTCSTAELVWLYYSSAAFTRF